MDKTDLRLQKQVRSFFLKNDLDLSCADVRVSYGTCIVTGKIGRIPRSKVDSVEKRTEFVAGILYQINGIKEVVLQCHYQE